MFNKNNNVTDTKLHYRMYKSGKQWVYQSIAIGLIGLGGTIAIMNEHVVSHADTVTTSQQANQENSGTIIYNAKQGNIIPKVGDTVYSAQGVSKYVIGGTEDAPVITLSGQFYLPSLFDNNIVKFIQEHPNTTFNINNAVMQNSSSITSVKLVQGKNGIFYILNNSNNSSFVNSITLNSRVILNGGTEFSKILPSSTTDLSVGSSIQLNKNSDNLFANLPNVKTITTQLGEISDGDILSANNLFANDPNLYSVDYSILFSADKVVAHNIFNNDISLYSFLPSLINSNASLNNKDITLGSNNKISKNFVTYAETRIGNEGMLVSTDGTTSSFLNLLQKSISQRFASTVFALPDTFKYINSVNTFNNSSMINVMSTSQKTYQSLIQYVNTDGSYALMPATNIIGYNNVNGVTSLYDDNFNPIKTTTFNSKISPDSNGQVSLSQLTNNDGIYWFGVGDNNEVKAFFSPKIVAGTQEIYSNDLFSVNKNPLSHGYSYTSIVFKPNSTINIKGFLGNKEYSNILNNWNASSIELNGLKSDDGRSIKEIGSQGGVSYVATNDNNVYIGLGSLASSGLTLPTESSVFSSNHIASNMDVTFLYPVSVTSSGLDLLTNAKTVNNMSNVSYTQDSRALNDYSGPQLANFNVSPASLAFYAPSSSTFNKLDLSSLNAFNITPQSATPGTSSVFSVLTNNTLSNLPHLTQLVLSSVSLLGPNAKSVGLYNGNWTDGNQILTGDQLANGNPHPGTWVSDKDSTYNDLAKQVIKKDVIKATQSADTNNQSELSQAIESTKQTADSTQLPDFTDNDKPKNDITSQVTSAQDLVSSSKTVYDNTTNNPDITDTDVNKAIQSALKAQSDAFAAFKSASVKLTQLHSQQEYNNKYNDALKVYKVAQAKDAEQKAQELAKQQAEKAAQEKADALAKQKADELSKQQVVKQAQQSNNIPTTQPSTPVNKPSVSKITYPKYINLNLNNHNAKAIIKVLRRHKISGQDLKLPTMRVIKASKLANNKLKYTVRIANKTITFIVNNSVKPAYISRKEVSSETVHLKVLNTTFEHKHTKFTTHTRVHKIKKGTILTATKFIDNHGVTRFQLATGNFVTGNKYFVSIKK